MKKDFRDIDLPKVPFPESVIKTKMNAKDIIL